MASFQIHEDQENQRMTLRNQKGANDNGQLGLKRTALRNINSNARNSNRLGKNEGKPFENVQPKCEEKPKRGFTIHLDDDLKIPAPMFVRRQEPRQMKKVEPAVFTTSTGTAAATKTSKSSENDNPLESLPSSIASVMPHPHRQPLKELKTLQEEEPMSEGSFIEPDSPMAVDKSLTITPCSPVAKPLKARDNIAILCDLDEYRDDIYTHLMDIEKRFRPRPLYMRRQPDVTYSMRTVLVDWLVEVAEEYRLQTETLYLAVSYIDRFLSIMSVVRGKLQLLGTAAMFVASKYEEIYPPDVGEFVYLTDDSYTKKQVLRMENLILKVLDFNIAGPTPLAFLTHIATSCNLSNKELHLAMFVCELSLLEGDPYLQYTSSMLACSALAIARNCLNQKQTWPKKLIEETGYTLEELSQCVANLNESHGKASSLQQQAICEKYRRSKWSNASDIKPCPLIINTETSTS